MKRGLLKIRSEIDRKDFGIQNEEQKLDRFYYSYSSYLKFKPILRRLNPEPLQCLWGKYK